MASAKTYTIVIGAGILTLLAVFGIYNRYENAVEKKPETRVRKTVDVPAGFTTAEIAALLEEGGIITDALPFIWYCRFQGLDGKLQAGEYELDSADGIPAIAATLAAGRVHVIRFTIPNSWRPRPPATAASPRTTWRDTSTPTPTRWPRPPARKTWSG
jgi:cell division protein YceG involved in septum cleavage